MPFDRTYFKSIFPFRRGFVSVVHSIVYYSLSLSVHSSAVFRCFYHVLTISVFAGDFDVHLPRRSGRRALLISAQSQGSAVRPIF